MMSVGIDADQARKLFRAYRGARAAGRGVRGYRRAKSMLDSHAAQTDALIDAEGIVSRVRDKQVDSHDVRDIGRGVIKATPRVYRFVSRHIRKNREE